MRAISFFFLLAMAMAAGPAQAQFVIKRVKCSDAVVPADFERPLVPFHVQFTGVSRAYHVQVVRDGCRPKLQQGQMVIRLRTPVGNTDNGIATMLRTHRYPDGTSVLVPSGYGIYIQFLALSGDKVTGTFDYMYSWE